MKRIFFNVAILAFVYGMVFSLPAAAQLTQTNGCPPTATNCTGSNQNSGDTLTTVNNGDSRSNASQLGNSTASNVSGNQVGFDNRAQTTQNANNTTTGTISGGNTTSGATGGAATGNLSNNDNRSSVGNTSATTGASTSNSGGNNLTNGSNTATNTANGGAGGAGGAGGTAVSGSNAAGGAGGTASNTGTNAQGQGQSSRNSVAGGNQNASTRSGVAESGNANVSVGGSSYSDNSRVTFIPAIVPPTPPSSLAVGNIVKETSACGPLQRVIKRKVDGTFFGIVTTEKVDQGYTEELDSYYDENGVMQEYIERPTRGGFAVFGHQVTMHSAIVGVSGARQLTLGGGGSSGSWGQGGTGTSAANQQMVTTIQLRLCEVARIVPEPIIVPAPVAFTPIVERPAPIFTKKIVKPKKFCK